MNKTTLSVQEHIEKMIIHFELLVNYEPDGSDFIISFDNGNGSDLFSLRLLKYKDGEYHLFNMSKTKEISVPQLYDMLTEQLKKGNT